MIAIMKYLIIILLIVFGYSINALAQNKKYRNPFSVPFKKVPKEIPSSKPVLTPPVSSEPLNVTVEGVIWSRKLRQAIIDGKVYHEGEKIKGMDAKIVRIDNNKVSIVYNGVLYEESIRKRRPQ